MLKNILGRPPLTRTLSPPLVRTVASSRPAFQHLQQQPSSSSTPSSSSSSSQALRMIPPPSKPTSQPHLSRAHLVSPTSVEQPPPDLSDEQLSTSTAELYEDPHRYTPEELARPETHGGPYAEARSKLDFSYHRKPTLERRRLQDQIVSQVLAESHAEECRFCHSSTPSTPINDSNDRPLDHGGHRPRKPVALFTSGGMGAGKGHVLRTFLENGTIRLDDNFVWIDPDKISRILPERPLYLSSNPLQTATLLHPESSLVQELLTHAARAQHRSVVIDGSLSCSDWFRGVMYDFRSAGYLVEVLFVFCRDEDIMWQRAERRRLKTGRRVSKEQIHKSRLQSPVSVRVLSSPSANSHESSIDRLRLVDNSSDDAEFQPKIVYDSTDDSSWQEGVGGEVDVEAIALGQKTNETKAEARSKI